LQRLYQQTQRLEAGDYTARSALRGEDELAQPCYRSDGRNLQKTLVALQAQETARRSCSQCFARSAYLIDLAIGLEAVLDGVVEGRKAQQYLKRSLLRDRLSARLVEQLLLLAKADAGQPVSPPAVSAVAIAQNASSGCSRLLLKQAWS